MLIDEDDILVDSDESRDEPVKKAPSKMKGYAGLSKKSKAARARKRDMQDLQDSSSSESDVSPVKKKKVERFWDLLHAEYCAQFY